MGIKNTPLQDVRKIDILNLDFRIVISEDPAKDLAEPSGAPTLGGSALFCFKKLFVLVRDAFKIRPKIFYDFVGLVR